ncbi:MAG: hypothetical protein RSA67_06325, partial [Alistipes sp.]
SNTPHKADADQGASCPKNNGYNPYKTSADTPAKRPCGPHEYPRKKSNFLPIFIINDAKL